MKPVEYWAVLAGMVIYVVIRDAVASAVVEEVFLADAAAPLADPPWGADMTAATRAQALIRIGEPAGPGHLAAIIGDDAGAAIAVLGVVREVVADA